MDYYSFTDPGGWKAELADLQQKVYQHSGHLSTTGQGKSAGQRLMS